MRIVAIRCENLTSLVGRSALELDQPPLRDLGIFTITGPTGSGKSTLLDAMCLALFGTAPRLEDQGRGVKVGREDEDPSVRLPLGDARTLVSRGAGHGMAEVEFIGKSGHRYVARWEARRARGRASARFQDAEMSLVDRDTGERLGRTKTEVLAAVERALGLDADQFRRSALLSQGDFAAFLGSAGEQRSLLLEQMTGTGIYSAISQAAHERAKTASDEVALLAAGMGAVQRQGLEAREALSSSIEERTALLQVRKAELSAIEAAVRFYDRRSELARLVVEAQTQAGEQSRAERDAAGEREELERVERAAPLRPLVKAHGDASLRNVDASLRLGEARKDRASAEQALAETREATLVHEKARAEAQKAAADAEPELAAAARLDSAIEQVCSGLRAATERLDAAARALAEAKDDAARLDEPIASAEARRDEAVRWLEQNAHVEPLAEQWPRWRELLERFAAACEAEEQGETVPAQRQGGVSELEAVVARLTAARLAAEAAACAARFCAEDEAARDATIERLARLETLGPAVLAIQSMKAQAESETARAHALCEQAEAEGREAAQTEEDAEREACALDEAKHALESVRLTVDLASHRTVLVAGEPCPLCGATEHPYAGAGPPWDGLLEKQKRRVGEVESRLRLLRGRSAEHRALAAGARTSADEAHARAGVEAARAATHERAYQGAADSLGLGAIGSDASGLAVIDARRELERSRRELLREREREEGRRTCEAEEARRELETARASLERARAKETLAAAFVGRSGWQERLEADPLGLIDASEREVAHRSEHAEARATAESEIAGLEARRTAALATALERERVAMQRETERASLVVAVEAQRRERERLLLGRPTSEARAAVEDALDGATAALLSCRDASLSAVVAVAGAAARLEAAEADAARAGAELGRTEAALGERTSDLGLGEPALLALLARDDAWIAMTRDRLTAVASSVRAAEAVLADRTRAREAHEAAARPELAETEARSLLAPARAALDQTSFELAAAISERAHDDRAQALFAERSAAWEDGKKKAERWQLLDCVIGSRDGKVLRDFAQGLTLDALLAHANRHLLDLAPRYLLMRVPGHDMELQIVDCDMADEVRGTNTLSGGETFLVSLALALALSSFAARDVRIETLFIDEGFGALDPATLDVAIAALDALRQTGRQVGVISHVAALADKIGAQVRVQRIGGGRSRVVLRR